MRRFSRLAVLCIATACAPSPAVNAPVCGDGACATSENSWSCAADCPARCGDGVCSHGEVCANCAADCDCTTLAATPPMGWNSWNRFQCNIDETLARATADALVSSGMQAAGYRFINLDDCWQTDRAADGTIIADPVKFASGIAKLASDIHAKGLEFGVYTCAGPLTCALRPGSKDHEFQDMATYASWGVDYVKVDWCGTNGYDARTQYGLFHDGIAQASHRLVLSLCNWGEQLPWIWGAGAGQLWRTSGDISDSYFSMVLNTNVAAQHAAYAGPGHWNDPDMLEVGNGKMTLDEYRSHMALWAILSAPLIAGCDLRTMDAATRELLTNPEVIAVDQDALGLQGLRIAEATDTAPEIWAKPLAQPGWRAVVVFNPGDVTATADLTTVDFALAPGVVQVRDLWAKSDIGALDKLGPLVLAPHASRMFRLAGAEATLPSGQTAVSALKWSYPANSQGEIARDTAFGGTPLTIAGTAFSHGLGAYSGSVALVAVSGRCTAFRASIGIDQIGGGKGSVGFEVWADGKRVFSSGVVTGADGAKSVDVDLTGVTFLKLVTTSGNDSEDNDFADWADASLTCN